MITQIGLAAGAIWQFLDDRGDSLVSEMKVALQISEELSLMALGWLAREGYVLVSCDGTDFRVALRSARHEDLSR